MKRIFVALLAAQCAAWAVDLGDTYVNSSISDAKNLNPVLVADSASDELCGLIYNGLVKYDKDLNVIGDLAESYEVRRGGLELVFHLRHGVRWHDGQPFTADDVLFTYQKVRDPKTICYFADEFLDVDQVTAPDPYTVRVTYKKPYAPGLGSWGLHIIAKHVYAGGGDFNAHPANRKPIGTGPFKFKAWKTDQYVTLDANLDYFEGRPDIDHYVYRIIPDQSVQFMEMRNQSVDGVELTPDQFKAYDAMFQHHQRFRYPAFKYIYMGFNLQHPLFRDLRVRRAITMAIDRQALVDGILLGLGHPISGPYPLNAWAYNKSVAPLPYDLTAARQWLAEAGWRPDADGHLKKDGNPFAFTLLTNQGNKVRELSAEIIQQQLAKLGIDVQIRVMEFSALQDQLDKKNFDAVIIGWQLGLDPDNYSIWHSGERFNFVSYHNPDVDRLLIDGRRTFDLAARTGIYHQLHALIAADCPYVFLYCPDDLIAIHKRFQGPAVAPAGIGWNFREWWVPRDQQRYKTEIVP